MPRIIAISTLIAWLAMFPGARTMGDTVATVGESALRQVVFGYAQRNSEERSEKACLMRWESPWSVRLDLVGDDDRNAVAQQVLARFSKLAAIPVTFTDDPAAANLVVETYAAGRLSEKRYKGKCSASRTVDRDCRIVRATVRLPVSLTPAQFDYCLNHELMHAVGLQGHAWGVESILDPDRDRRSLSPWDEWLLQSIYGEQVQAGDGVHETVRALAGEEQ